VIAPLATAAPSVFTESAIQAPATSGSCDRYRSATNGRNSSSTTAKITTSDDTMIATTGRARIAAPVAIAAETPQIEMPEASGAAHSRLNLNQLRAT
jgi:type II secretory pathway component HofQ